MINKDVENAALLLAELKAKPGTKLGEFCELRGLSKDFMEQIGSKLRKAGLLTSKRGPGGGYTLAKSKITLIDLVNVFMSTKLKNKTTLNEQIIKSIADITIG